MRPFRYVRASFFQGRGGRRAHAATAGRALCFLPPGLVLEGRARRARRGEDAALAHRQRIPTDERLHVLFSSRPDDGPRRGMSIALPAQARLADGRSLALAGGCVRALLRLRRRRARPPLKAIGSAKGPMPRSAREVQCHDEGIEASSPARGTTIAFLQAFPARSDEGGRPSGACRPAITASAAKRRPPPCPRKRKAASAAGHELRHRGRGSSVCKRWANEHAVSTKPSRRPGSAVGGQAPRGGRERARLASVRAAEDSGAARRSARTARRPLKPAGRGSAASAAGDTVVGPPPKERARRCPRGASPREGQDDNGGRKQPRRTDHDLPMPHVEAARSTAIVITAVERAGHWWRGWRRRPPAESRAFSTSEEAEGGGGLIAATSPARGLSG